MNEDLKTGLDAELPHGSVPFALDTDAAVRLGRRTRKRRKLLATGGSVLSAVAIAGLVVTVLTPGMSSHDQAADDKAPVAADPPPKLDPDKTYMWASGMAEPTDGAKPYSDAFWEHFAEKYPTAELYDMFDEKKRWAPVTGPRAEQATFGKEKLTLVENEGDTVGSELGPELYDRTVFSLNMGHGESGPGNSMSEVEVRFSPDAEVTETINVLVLQPGSYTKDSGDSVDPAYCNIDNGSVDFYSCDAKRATGPDGEDLRHVAMGYEGDGSEPVVSRHAVALYRADGSVVVVSDDAERMKQSEPGPTLSFGELTAIAAALPEKPVE